MSAETRPGLRECPDGEGRMDSMSSDPQLSFLAAWMTGAVDANAIDDYIDQWHDSGDDETRRLHEYLGMTWEQYKTWGETSRLPGRLAA